METIRDLFDLRHTLAKTYLQAYTYPWEALGGIREMITELGKTLAKEEYTQISPQVWVHRTAEVAPTAFLGAPCIIGPRTEVRHCAFVRGAALVGEDCVVGNSVEIKNAILFDGVQVPHFNYVGDSILGYMAHMGAGAVTSNVKSDKTPVTVRCGTEAVATGLSKLGAMLGDEAEIGCHAVLNPGAVVGRNANVYPLVNVRGTIPAHSICKSAGEIVKKQP